jgi:hypothetical protein
VRYQDLEPSPVPSAGVWYCDYYCSDYYCQDEWGNWFPATTDWYNAAYAEIMRLYGQRGSVLVAARARTRLREAMKEVL